jgi:hypothetical protein
MRVLDEVARLVRDELMTLIQPVALLSVNPNRKTGEVTGRFRSSGMLFDYKIGGSTVTYRPVGNGSGKRNDASDAYAKATQARALIEEIRQDTRCKRPDGTIYGTRGRCRQGRELRTRSSASANRPVSYKGYDLSPPPNPAYEGKNPDVARVTRALRNRIGRLEPATTREMIDIAGKHGTKLEGLQHRLKAEKSLGRKIENEYRLDEFDGDMRKCADSMSDVVRYTMKTTNERYTDTVEKVISDFEAKGYTARVKNYWEEGQPYRGMNIALTSPDGLKVELQMHTPQSLYVKHKTHPLYEQYRVEKDNKRRKQLFDRLLRITDSLVPPWGAARTGAPARSGQVRALQRQTAAQRERLLSIGERKKLGYQTAAQAGLV